jgi:hypothetical protein
MCLSKISLNPVFIVQDWIDWNTETPGLFQGPSTLVLAPISTDSQTHLTEDWMTWVPAYLGAFSITQPPHHHHAFLQLGLDIIRFESGWFVLALEDCKQFEWL